MGKYTKNNVSVIKAELIRSAPSLFASVYLPKLVQVAKDVAEYIDEASTETGISGLPMFTGALHDTTGIGVYYNGALVAIEKPPSLYNLQGSLPYQQQDFNPDMVLEEAVKRAGGTTKDGIWMVIFSAAPYAIEVNREGSYAKSPRGEGYFDDIVFFTTRLLSSVFNSN